MFSQCNLQMKLRNGIGAIPKRHDVSVSAEAGQAHAVVDGDHVGSQHEGRLGDVVHEEARLRGHQKDFGLPLRAHHGEVPIPAGVLGGRGGEVDQLALPRPLGVLGGVGVPPHLVGALNERPHAVQEAKTQHGAFQHEDGPWERRGQRSNRPENARGLDL